MTIDQWLNSVPHKDLNQLWRSGRPLVIFGVGGSGQDALRFLTTQGKEVAFFCDNDVQKQGLRHSGVEVIPPEQLSSIDSTVLIASDWARDIAHQLNDLGLNRHFYFNEVFRPEWRQHFSEDVIRASRRQISEFDSILEDASSRSLLRALLEFRLTLDSSTLTCANFVQYGHPSVSVNTGDFVIDGGAWQGDTCLQYCQAGARRVMAFEPDPGNHRLLLNNLDATGFRNCVEPVSLGLWHDNDRLRFEPSDNTSDRSRLDQEGSSAIEVTSLDRYLRECADSVDLIKLDIEGAERQAIEGAVKTITESKPKLQISVYHRPDDLWLIPLAIHRLQAGYRFFLGHHSGNLVDTVLYATVE